MNQETDKRINEELTKKINEKITFSYWNQGIITIASDEMHALALTRIKKIIQDIEPRIIITAMVFDPQGLLIVNFDKLGSE